MWIGIPIALAVALLPVARMNSEERMLEAEFGVAYRDMRQATWRLVPLIY